MTPSAISQMPPVRAAMTPSPYSIELDAPVRLAQGVMAEHGIRHLPVTDEKGDLVGILADRDLKRSLDPSIGLPPKNELFVRDVCVLDPYVVDPWEPLDGVLLEMAERHVGSALVVEEGKLVGIFTATDACRRFAEFLRAQFPSGGGEPAA
jgi:acetoin utilization protein AcuB